MGTIFGNRPMEWQIKCQIECQKKATWNADSTSDEVSDRMQDSTSDRMPAETSDRLPRKTFDTIAYQMADGNLQKISWLVVWNIFPHILGIVIQVTNIFQRR